MESSDLLSIIIIHCFSCAIRPPFSFNNFTDKKGKVLYSLTISRRLKLCHDFHYLSVQKYQTVTRKPIFKSSTFFLCMLVVCGKMYHHDVPYNIQLVAFKLVTNHTNLPCFTTPLKTKIFHSSNPSLMPKHKEMYVTIYD